MSTKGRLMRQGSGSFIPRRNNGSTYSQPESQTTSEAVLRSSSRFKTMREPTSSELPLTYEEYHKSPVVLGPNDVLGARSPSTPQKVVEFSAVARSVVGGFNAPKEGYIKIKGFGSSFLFNNRKYYLQVQNAKLRILSEPPSDDKFDDEIQSLLEIPFVELRSIQYPKATKDFRIVFTCQEEVDGGIAYRAHTLSFQAKTAEVAQDWVKSFLVGCINTALFLRNIVDYLIANSPEEKHIEAFLRQIVDLTYIAKGQICVETVNAQERLAKFLITHEKREEGEFWRNFAYESNIRLMNDEIADTQTALRVIQDDITASIAGGAIDFAAEFVPEKRTTSSVLLPARLILRNTSKANGTKRNHGSSPKKIGGTTRDTERKSNVTSEFGQSMTGITIPRRNGNRKESTGTNSSSENDL